MILPDRSADAEDAFVSALADSDGDDLLAAIEAALLARRPRLAARLVQLVDGEAEPGSALERARHAASFWLIDDVHVPWPDWTDAFGDMLRRRRRRRRDGKRGDRRR